MCGGDSKLYIRPEPTRPPSRKPRLVFTNLQRSTVFTYTNNSPQFCKWRCAAFISDVKHVKSLFLLQFTLTGFDICGHRHVQQLAYALHCSSHCKYTAPSCTRYSSQSQRADRSILVSPLFDTPAFAAINQCKVDQYVKYTGAYGDIIEQRIIPLTLGF